MKTREMKRRLCKAFMIALALMLLTFTTGFAETTEEQHTSQGYIAAEVDDTEQEDVELPAVSQPADKPDEVIVLSDDEETTEDKQDDIVESRTTDENTKTHEQTEIEQNLYTIYFYDYDGTEILSLQQDLHEGEIIKQPEWAPEHEGLAFRYWFDEDDEQLTPFQFLWERVSRDVHLIARYELLPVYYETDPESYPIGFDESGMSGAPDLRNGIPKPVKREKVDIGTVISDGSLEGTVVDSRGGAGFTVVVIHVNDEALDEADILQEDEMLQVGEEAEEAEEVDDLDEEEEPEEDEEPEEEEEPEEDEFKEGEGFVEGEEPEEGEEQEIDGDVFAKLSEQRPYEFGETVTLNGWLEGFEGAIGLDYQWQFSEDGENWTDQEGATGLSYSYTYTEGNQHYKWRLQVFITTPTTENGDEQPVYEDGAEDSVHDDGDNWMEPESDEGE